MKKKQRPFGTWPSAISPSLVAGSSIRLGELASDNNGTIYWIETRPEEGGRCALVTGSMAEGIRDVLPQELSARSRIHEYGGGALLAASNGEIYFTNSNDQDVYRLGADETVKRLTRETDTRFADYSLCPKGLALYAVTERHSGRNEKPPQNFLSLIGTRSGAVKPIREGADFYAAPRVSPDGKTLVWLEWNLPHMPWQAATLYQATIGGNDLLENIRHIAGGPGNPVFQCQWDESGALYFVMETDEWSQLYCCRNGTISQISNFEGEAARPLWVLGMRSYALLGNKRIALVAVENGEHRLWLIDEAQGTTTPVGQPHRQIFDPVKSGDNSIFAIVADDDAPPAVVEIDMNGHSRLIHRPGSVALEKGDISIGQTVALKTAANETIFAIYYPPRNAAFDGPGDTLPPVIFSAHGGPTGCADRGLKLKIQYWTNRGFAFFDVDYRGSTGYGATYRSKLDGQWGNLDAADMIAAAKAAVAMNLADTNALLISGGSAGGFTALMALCIGDIFRAATISYGVADLATLLATTHKFEAGYLYGLTGTTENKTEPQFTNRSPLHQAHNIKSPVLFLQGLEDKVVPAEQSRAMAQAIERCGVPVTLVEFAGEGHGFRGGETIRKALECEFAFYAEHLGFNGR